MRVLQLKEFSELSERRKVPVLDWRAGLARWTGKPDTERIESALDRQAKVTVLSETCACP